MGGGSDHQCCCYIVFMCVLCNIVVVLCVIGVYGVVCVVLFVLGSDRQRRLPEPPAVPGPSDWRKTGAGGGLY